MNVTQITDILTGKNVSEYYRLFRETQWYDEGQMKAFQLEKLKKLIMHSYNHVPFYRNIMKQQGILPEDVRSIDILKEFPIITKDIIREQFNDFMPDNIKEIKGSKTSQTGGTTGGILYARNDANTRSSIWAAFKRFEDWMGIKPRDRALILMGGHVIGKHWKDRLKKTVNLYLRNCVAFSPYDTTDANINNIIRALKNNQFELIRSYSQFLFSLAKRLQDENLAFDVRAITTTAEPLMPEHRALFESVFHAEIFDQYGFGEIGGVAFECSNHNGMHITEERVIVELNENNEVIVTDLDNFSLPFIRYWNADQAIISDETCSCGRKSKLIKKIMGRNCDYIIGLNGEFLHWAYFWHLLFDSEVAEKRNLKKFQIIQPAKDRLKIRMIANPLTEDEKYLLVSNIQSRAGMLNIDFSFENEIENAASGKYRAVINHLL